MPTVPRKVPRRISEPTRGLHRAPLAIVVLLLVAAMAEAQGDPFIRSIARVKQAIAPIACGVVRPDGTHQGWGEVIGTAFFIEDVHNGFVTAAHVFKGAGTCASLSVAIPEGGEWTAGGNSKLVAFSLSDCHIDHGADLAVCRTRGDLRIFPTLRVRPLTIRSDSYPDGTPVAFSGFPFQRVQPITSRGHIASTEASGGRIVIDKPAWRGVSGSPLFVDDGQVIGVIFEAHPGLVYARPSSVLRQVIAAFRARQ